MGTLAGAEIDGWLRGGGLVVTASDRAARALQSAFHQRRRAEDLDAWPTPTILSWSAFVRNTWQQCARDGRMVLSPTQEQALWADIAGDEKHLATVLEGPRHRLAALAMQAHELICSYAPRYLREAARASWDRDAASFSRWLTAFDRICHQASLLSPNRAPLALISLLLTDSTQRPPLLVAGFDRLLPVQQSLFGAWGTWQQLAHGEPAAAPRFYHAPDKQAELDACALWCTRTLATNPQTRLLVITQEIAARRGEIERAFLRHSRPGAAPPFEFSLGIPLSHVALARAAHLILRWLAGSLEENEIDWLLSTGLAASNPDESAALQACMRALRRKGLQRPQWNLQAFTNQRHISAQPLAAWIERMNHAQRRLADARSAQSPLDWAALVPQLLQDAGLPGEHRLTSAEFQAYQRWEQAVDSCGSLGFDGRRIAWPDFLNALARALDETLFAPESSDAPIQIAGPAESAGLTADAIWFLGADEDAWPASGSTHPLLPLPVQRQAAMPHATPLFDWDLAQSITARLASSSPEIHFSFAAQKADLETRPSRIVAQLTGPPQPLPADLAHAPSPPSLAVSFQDFSRIPFQGSTIGGGSSVLTSQSQCPFKAFATARLGAQAWEPAEAGLTAAQRGQLLHAVLHAIWAGPPHGIRTREELLSQPGLESFVETHVKTVLREKMPAAAREFMPRRYLALEEQRLTRLVIEWLEYEKTRLSFTVDETEAKHTVSLAGLTFSLRLDRIDRLDDGSLLVIDYKSGDVSPRSWQLPRPDDVQLPLYAGFALDSAETLGGLVFAKVRAGDQSLTGHLADARATLFAGLKGSNSLVKSALSAEQLSGWKSYIEQLARDFVSGRADVDPRDPPQTCQRCGLQTLCRIQEREDTEESEDDAGNDEVADE